MAASGRERAENRLAGLEAEGKRLEGRLKSWKGRYDRALEALKGEVES